MRLLVAALTLLAVQPSWALYKCVGATGSVSFQEQPCERSQAQTAIKPLVEAPRATAAPAARYFIIRSAISRPDAGDE